MDRPVLLFDIVLRKTTVRQRICRLSLFPLYFHQPWVSLTCELCNIGLEYLSLPLIPVLPLHSASPPSRPALRETLGGFDCGPRPGTGGVLLLPATTADVPGDSADSYSSSKSTVVSLALLWLALPALFVQILLVLFMFLLAEHGQLCRIMVVHPEERTRLLGDFSSVVTLIFRGEYWCGRPRRASMT